MNLRQAVRQVTTWAPLNFHLTNHLGRNVCTMFMGWFSKIENPWIARLSIRIWGVFTDLDLREAETREFSSLHACFTRSLRPGVRPQNMDPGILTSPSDGIVGAMGVVQRGMALQAKGMSYPLDQLLQSKADAHYFEGGTYITLRLTSAMYHRFHAPHDLRIERIQYVAGEVWNVNPPALERVSRLFCENERAVIHANLQARGQRIALVPVAAVLVASIRLHFVDVLLHLRYRGPKRMLCDHRCSKGDELGWFEHGSTIIVLAPKGFAPAPGIASGTRMRVGQALLLEVKVGATDCSGNVA